MADMVFSGVTFTGGYSIALPSVATDPYFMYNSLLLPGNGTNGAQNNTFLDGSTNNFAITRNGNTTQGTFSPYGPNWSNYFGGASNYITVPYSAALAFGTGDFCVEFWLYWTGGANENNGIMNNASGGFNLKLSATNPANWALENSYVGQVADFGTAPTKNAWHHIAVTRSSGTLYAFIDGTQVFSGANSTNFTNTNTWYIGANGYSVSTYYIIGNLSNLRIVVGSAVYTSNFTPSTTPLTAIANTSLLTCQSNRFIDNSTNNFTITKNGDTNVQRFSPFSPSTAYDTSTIGGSGYFDGTGDYLTYNAGTSLNFAGDFTVEAWVYRSTASLLSVIDTRTGANYTNIMCAMTASGTMDFIANDGTNRRLTTTAAATLGAWNHLAWVRSGTTVTAYLNGVSAGTVFVGGTLNAAQTTAWIGSVVDPIYGQGYLSNLRIVNGTAVYTSGFTPPTAPVTAITNTQLLTNYTNAGIIDNTMINTLETVGDAKISTTQSKFGGSSMAFDGTGDYLTQPNSQNFNFGTGNFTMEGWFYQTGLSSSYPGIVSNPLGWGNAGAWSVLSSHASSGVRKLQFHCYNADASNPLLLGTTTLSDNTWYYFAVTRSGTTFRLFLNGIIEATATFSGAVTSTSSGLVVGINQTAYPFQGYIDDLRITKGYARYTATFTPPTAAFPLY